MKKYRIMYVIGGILLAIHRRKNIIGWYHYLELFVKCNHLDEEYKRKAKISYFIGVILAVILWPISIVTEVISKILMK